MFNTCSDCGQFIWLSMKNHKKECPRLLMREAMSRHILNEPQPIKRITHVHVEESADGSPVLAVDAVTDMMDDSGAAKTDSGPDR